MPKPCFAALHYDRLKLESSFMPVVIGCIPIIFNSEIGHVSDSAGQLPFEMTLRPSFTHSEDFDPAASISCALKNDGRRNKLIKHATDRACCAITAQHLFAPVYRHQMRA